MDRFPWQLFPFFALFLGFFSEALATNSDFAIWSGSGLYESVDTEGAPFLIKLDQDGSAHASPHRRRMHAGADVGQWELAAPGTIRIEWRSGYWDLLQISHEGLEMFAFNLRDLSGLGEEFAVSLRAHGDNLHAFSPWLEPGLILAGDRLDGFWQWAADDDTDPRFLRLDRWGRVREEIFHSPAGKTERRGFWRLLPGGEVLIQWSPRGSTRLTRTGQGTLEVVGSDESWQPISRSIRDNLVVSRETQAIHREMEHLRTAQAEARKQTTLGRIQEDIQARLQSDESAEPSDSSDSRSSL